MIREAVQQLAAGGDLTREQASLAMDEIMTGDAPASLVGGFLVGLRIKGETIDEIVGLASSMRRHAVPVVAPPGAVDTCGTGGDRAGTFNISTAAALVVAGAGAVVAKHGNRSASSQCGSADVLEALGVRVTLAPREVEACMSQAGIGFLFAMSFHPAMRHAAAVRGELGIRTVFNLLGPLANPAGVRRQALGVGAPEAAETMTRVLQALGHERALVFFGTDGLDELTTTGPSHVFDLADGGVSEYDVDPVALGLAPARAEDLRGGDAAVNAEIVRAVVGGARGPHRDIVALNAAAGLVAAGVVADFPAGLELAFATLDSGAAAATLERLVRVSTGFAR